jgi:hypothetical protein
MTTTRARPRLLQQPPITLADLANLSRWVAWRQETKRRADGSTFKTKIPYDPNSDQQARIPTEPSSWGTRDQAEVRCRTLLRRGDVGGVGIVLGQFDDDTLLMGIDLDRCLPRSGDLTRWAVEIIERFATYAEVSPGGEGVKLFFCVAAEDAAAVKQMFGTDPKTGKLKTRKAFEAGEHREIAIDRARYYAVTGDLLENVPDTLRVVGVDDVRWFVEQAGPAYLRRHGVGGKQQRSRDESGSGYGFRFMAARKAAGDSYLMARNAILADRGEAGKWARRVDERQLERAWDNAGGGGGGGLDVVRVADVEMRRVDWVWPLHLARGKVTIIAGDPGVGKSHLGIDITGRITKPGDATWPDGNEQAPFGSVVILSAEDAVNDTIHPRLLAAYADVRRVHVIRAVCNDDGTRRTFNLQCDLAQLEQLIADLGDVVLVIIDPISSYLGEGIEGNAITSVRPVLEAVGALAERSNVAVLLIHHPPKHTTGKAMHQFSGSLAFVAAPRLSFLAVAERDQEGEETGRKLMLAVKNTLGAKAAGLGYRIRKTFVDGPHDRIETSYVAWDHAPVTITADAALRDPQPPTKLEQAKELLCEMLANGRKVDSREIIAMAAERGIGEHTLRDAKVKLGVKSHKTGFQGESEWELIASHGGRRRL